MSYYNPVKKGNLSPVSQPLLDAVQRAMSIEKLRQAITVQSKNIARAYNLEMHGTGDDRYWFRNNGSSILAVAHADSVQSDRFLAYCKEQNVIFSPVLDDRLGVYSITHMLQALKVNVDILICDNEERGASTASNFKTEKEYDFMVEFDRAGEDVVTYCYVDNEWLGALKDAGFQLGHGSYSDISNLEHLRCCGVNIGVGYADYHNYNAYALLDQYQRNMARFLALVAKHTPGKRYEHTPVTRSRVYGGWRYDSADWDDARWRNQDLAKATYKPSTWAAHSKDQIMARGGNDDCAGSGRTQYDTYKRLWEKLGFESTKDSSDTAHIDDALDWIGLEVSRTPYNSASSVCELLPIELDGHILVCYALSEASASEKTVRAVDTVEEYLLIDLINDEVWSSITTTRPNAYTRWQLSTRHEITKRTRPHILLAIHYWDAVAQVLEKTGSTKNLDAVRKYQEEARDRILAECFATGEENTQENETGEINNEL